MSSAGDADGTRGRKPSKFKPKSSIRRSEIERAEQEQAESSRRRQRELEASKTARQSRGRGTRGDRGRGRGRGGSDFRGGLSSWQSATGFLGQALPQNAPAPEDITILEPEFLGTSQIRQDPVVRPVSSDARTRKKTIAKATNAPKLKKEDTEAGIGDGDFKTASTDIEVQREGINVDYLAQNDMISDDEAEIDRDGNRRKALYPVRLKRKPHVERKTTIDTTASSKYSEQIRQVAIDEGVSVSDLQVNLANDGVDFVDQHVKMEEDTKPIIPVGRRSARNRRLKTREYVTLSDDDDDPKDMLQQSKRKQKYQALFSKPVLQTPEDHDEWERHQADMKAIAEELGNDETNDTASKRKETKGRRDDRVYLLQLPPLMPNLRARFTMAFDEQEETEVDMSRQTAGSSDKGKAPMRPQESNHETAVKVEDDTRGVELQASSEPELSFNASSEPNFRGPVGTLTVFASGATALDWGGIEFQLERGMGSMLQETLLVEKDSGVANSMSQVATTFIVKPNWDALFEAQG